MKRKNQFTIAAAAFAILIGTAIYAQEQEK